MADTFTHMSGKPVKLLDNGDGTYSIGVSSLTTLSSSLDSIDVAKMSNGGTTIALNAVTSTTTSAEISVGASGFKHVKVELLGASFSSGNFVVSLSGCEISGGTFGSIYVLRDDGTFAALGAMTINSNVNVVYVLPNIAVNYLKIAGTRTTDGTLTARVTPFN